MVYQLEALAALSKDLDFDFQYYIVPHIYLYFRFHKSNMLFQPPQSVGMHVVYKQTQAKHLHT